jgi:cysteinyl-tRNA synthetase
LLEEFIQANPDATKPVVLETTQAAFVAYVQKNLPLLPTEVQPSDFEQSSQKAYHNVLSGGTITGEGAPGDNEAKVKMHLTTATNAAKGLTAPAGSNSSEDFYKLVEDVLRPYLDSQKGSLIKSDDYSIFSKLTQYWEREFREDMRKLNCLPPSYVTRVTEFIPENVGFIEKIVQKGFGYVTTDGSVYFDSESFEAAGNTYARLEPWNRNDKELQADGEGALSKKVDTEKKSDADFALWKASKPGEPSWPSPWGQGRPGWHIECSAMCSEVLGAHVDIHSGGIDLAFPHHDNELAQSEAYWCSSHHSKDQYEPHQWINYFLHIGHLSISGSKMSKSLKNFVTIKEALERGGTWTARGLRIVFLMGGWRDGIEITDSVRTTAKAWEDSVNVSDLLLRVFLKLTNIEILLQCQSSCQRTESERCHWRALKATLQEAGA